MSESTERHFTIRDLLAFTSLVAVCLLAFRSPPPMPLFGALGLFGAFGTAVAFGVSRQRKFLVPGFILGVVIAPTALAVGGLVLFVLMRGLE